MKYNFIIKLNAIVVTIVITIILAIIWLFSIPFRLFADIVSLSLEFIIDNEKYYHNYIAVSFINYITNIKEVYKKMTDECMINDYLKDCGVK